MISGLLFAICKLNLKCKHHKYRKKNPGISDKRRVSFYIHIYIIITIQVSCHTWHKIFIIFYPIKPDGKAMSAC